MDDTEIRALLSRLGRPNAAGSIVVERATLLAEGADFPVIVDWIVAHAGEAETLTDSTARRGLHGPRLPGGDPARSRAAARFVLPADALR
jgi:hypothetical protein